MLPHSYNAGYSNDIRGFRKKNRWLRIFQQNAPYIAAAELLLLLILFIWATSHTSNQKGLLQKFELSHKSKETEIRNLANSLEQERRSRVSAENGLRESNSQLSGVRRELEDAKSSHSVKDQHTQALQESYERTRSTLEQERDTARRELEEAKQRMLSLESQISHKDSTIEAHKIVASRKEEQHSAKEKQWESMRSLLEEELKKQGGYIPQHGQASPGSPPAAHPDYAANDGTSAFHFTSDGHRERFIDTAKDLYSLGVSDPQGLEHLALLMGHLFEIKQMEYEAIQRAYPASTPPPKPPVGHWMALNLERMGVKLPHGVMHLSYILDAHYALANSPDAVGRGSQDEASSGGVPANPVINNTTPPVPPVQQNPTEWIKPSPPPIDHHGRKDDLGESGQQHDPSSGEANHAWERKRGKQRHRVDAAGFI